MSPWLYCTIAAALWLTSMLSYMYHFRDLDRGDDILVGMCLLIYFASWLVSIPVTIICIVIYFTLSYFLKFLRFIVDKFRKEEEEETDGDYYERYGER